MPNTKMSLKSTTKESPLAKITVWGRLSFRLGVPPDKAPKPVNHHPSPFPMTGFAPAGASKARAASTKGILLPKPQREGCTLRVTKLKAWLSPSPREKIRESRSPSKDDVMGPTQEPKTDALDLASSMSKPMGMAPAVPASPKIKQPRKKRHIKSFFIQFL
jgi:hypothetical protein